MTTAIRAYDPARDRDAAVRIWHEVGWRVAGQDEGIHKFVEAGRAWVADLNGQPECLVTTCDGDIRYQQADLRFSIVSGVTTGRAGRKRGLASATAAHAIAKDAEAGYALSMLGMFEQGFYNQLGYGTGPYLHLHQFDPANLTVSREFRVPIRLTTSDWQEMHACRVARLRRHGGVNVLPPECLGYELQWESENAFGLGYRDDSGTLTHYFWATCKDIENGPYETHVLCYQNHDQLMELLALMRSLGDQVRMIKIHEPPGIQFQDLLKQPFRFRQITHKGEFETGAKAIAYWQARICNVEACIAALSARASLAFNLELSDPIEKRLAEGQLAWQGVGGSYVVELGGTSSAKPGHVPSLPTLKASVGAFTRWWIGALPAASLSITDEFAASPDLISRLDSALGLPVPNLDWDF